MINSNHRIAKPGAVDANRAEHRCRLSHDPTSCQAVGLALTTCGGGGKLSNQLVAPAHLEAKSSLLLAVHSRKERANLISTLQSYRPARRSGRALRSDKRHKRSPFERLWLKGLLLHLGQSLPTEAVGIININISNLSS